MNPFSLKPRKSAVTFVNPRHELDIVCAATMESRPIVWILPDWLPQSKVTILAGEISSGKSTLACSIAARVSRGENHPSWGDQKPSTTKCGSVVFISTEDNYLDTILPRLEVAGAELSRIHFVKQTKVGSLERPFIFSDEEDLNSLEDAIPKFGHLRLIVMDPIYMAVSGDASNNSKARSVYEKLCKLAERLQCAILGIAHPVKNTKGKDSLSRVAGPGALVQVPRGIMMTSKIKEGAADDGTHILVLAKPFGKGVPYGLKYSIQSVPLNSHLGTIETSKIVWHGTRSGTPDENLQWADGANTLRRAKNENFAVCFLKRTLANGPLLASKIKSLADEENISARHLEKAKKALGIISTKQSGKGQFSQFEWSLPPTDEPNI